MQDKKEEERIKKEYGDTSKKIIKIINKNKDGKEKEDDESER